MNTIEQDKYGLYIHADNYKECLFMNQKAERLRLLWETIPKWRRLFIDKFQWFTTH